MTKEEAYDYAVWALPFARVAAHVYCRSLGINDPKKQGAAECGTFPELSATGWHQLYDWQSVLTDDEKQTGLEFIAFGRQEGDRANILIGFRGTDFYSAADWRANLRWFTRFLPLSKSDQYQVVHGHATRLVDVAVAKTKELFPSVSDYDVYTTGHSLGGGLAQLLAYSDSRVQAAVVFDPTPVTGYTTLVTDEQVNCSARVVRVYERGEALQYVRSVLRHFYTLSSNITEISFDLLHSRGNPVKNHSMTGLRGGIEARAKIDMYKAVPIKSFELPGSPDCRCYRSRRPEDMSKAGATCRM